MSLGRNIADLVNEGGPLSNAEKAKRALCLLDTLPVDDTYRPDMRAAAITFGLLAVADSTEGLRVMIGERT